MSVQNWKIAAVHGPGKYGNLPSDVEKTWVTGVFSITKKVHSAPAIYHLLELMGFLGKIFESIYAGAICDWISTFSSFFSRILCNLVALYFPDFHHSFGLDKWIIFSKLRGAVEFDTSDTLYSLKQNSERPFSLNK